MTACVKRKATWPWWTETLKSYALMHPAPSLSNPEDQSPSLAYGKWLHAALNAATQNEREKCVQLRTRLQSAMDHSFSFHSLASNRHARRKGIHFHSKFSSQQETSSQQFIFIPNSLASKRQALRTLPHASKHVTWAQEINGAAQCQTIEDRLASQCMESS